MDKQQAGLKAQLRHIDHTLAIFGYCDPPRDIKPKRPHAYRFKRRELPRILRRFADTSLTNREIALQVMAERCWDTDDRELVAKITDSIKSAKRWHKGRV